MISHLRLARALGLLFPPQKPATLPKDVIEAIHLYNKPEHRERLREWVNGTDRHAVDMNGQSALHHAVLYGKPQLVEFFLTKKLQKDLEDNKGLGWDILLIVIERKPIINYHRNA